MSEGDDDDDNAAQLYSQLWLGDVGTSAQTNFSWDNRGFFVHHAFRVLTQLSPGDPTAATFLSLTIMKAFYYCNILKLDFYIKRRYICSF